MGAALSWPSDYHLHTPLCKHAIGEPEEYRRKAAALGIREIAFADHAPAPDGYDPQHRMNLQAFPQYVRMVRAVQGFDTPAVLLGIEADYYPGGEAFLREWLAQQPFDVVLGSIHYLGTWGFDHDRAAWEWPHVNVTDAWREYFRLVMHLVESRLYDALAHPDLPKKFGFRPSDHDVREMVQPVLDRIAAAGMALELNTSGLRRPVGEIYPAPLILALARERNIPILFGSDAHRPADVGYEFAKAVALAREVGYTHTVRFRARQRVLVPLVPPPTDARATGYPPPDFMAREDPR